MLVPTTFSFPPTRISEMRSCPPPLTNRTDSVSPARSQHPELGRRLKVGPAHHDVSALGHGLRQSQATGGEDEGAPVGGRVGAVQGEEARPEEAVESRFNMFFFSYLYISYIIRVLRQKNMSL